MSRGRRIHAACIALLGLAAPAFAQQPDDRAVAFGRTIYSDKANCASCHGWAGDGQGDPHAHGVAAKLRDSKLTRAQLIEVIACGRPGAQMPHFDGYAYSDDPCYGLKDSDLSGNKPPDPPQTLQPKEIEAVADYLLAKVVGKGPPTKAECTEYFGGPAPACAGYP
jgi:mono/diheme cytochrome c family protein